MKNYSAISIFALLVALLFVASCKPDDPVDPNEEELITKVQLTFTDSANASNSFVATYSDPDGDGGAGPVRFDSIRLAAGMTYNVSIALYDESDPSHIHNVTTDVQEEAAEHMFCYTPSGATVTVTRTDSDGTFPIGITTKWRTGSASSGTTRVELRHQPDGQKDGTCTPGSTDVQLDFPTVIN